MNNIGGVVGGSVVDENDFEIRLPLLREDTTQTIAQEATVVVAGDDETDSWIFING